MKHDLSWGTLQAMSGDTALSESEDDSELDDAHNPRNKFLADFTFYIENVCESELGDERKQVPRQAGAPNPGLWQHLGVEER